MKKWPKRVFCAGLALFLFLVAWYAVTRIRSPYNAVKVIAVDVAGPEAVDTDELRIGCYNIAHGRGGVTGLSSWKGGTHTEKRDRVREIGRLIKEHNLDVLVLNEVDFKTLWSGHVDQTRLIAEEAGFPHVVQQRSRDASIPFIYYRSGNAILSKFPISNAKCVPFAVYRPVEAALIGCHKGVVCTVTLPNGRRLRVMGVHLEWRDEATRVESARRIMTTARESDVPLLAAGDFNSAPSGYPVHQKGKDGKNAMDVFFESGFFQDAPVGGPTPEKFTFPSEDPDRTIDWILVPPDWSVQEHKVVRSDLSDHFPLVASVALPDTELSYPAASTSHYDVAGTRHVYLVQEPEEKPVAANAAVFIYMHGMGGQEEQGMELFPSLRAHLNERGWIYICPRDDEYDGLISHLEQRYGKRNVYLSGASAGGRWALREAMRNPARYAGLVLLCPAERMSRLLDLTKDSLPMPIYMVCGEEDSMYAATCKMLVKVLSGPGRRIHYRELPGGDHNAPCRLTNWKKAVSFVAGGTG